MSDSTQFHDFDHLDPTVPGDQVRAKPRIAITELRHALPDLRQGGAVSESGLVGGTLMTLTELPVAFTPRTRP